MPFNRKLQNTANGEIKGPFGIWPFTFLNRFFGRNGNGNGGVAPTGLRWSSVIDKLSMRGLPPSLVTDTMRYDIDTKPFSFMTNKKFRIKRDDYRDGVFSKSYDLVHNAGEKWEAYHPTTGTNRNIQFHSNWWFQPASAGDYLELKLVEILES